MPPLRAPRDPVRQDVVRGLDVERLLDFGVRREEQVEEDEGRDEGGEERICSWRQRDVAATEARGPSTVAYRCGAALRPMRTALTIIMDKQLWGRSGIQNQ